jgi:hypothetical protein
MHSCIGPCPARSSLSSASLLVEQLQALHLAKTYFTSRITRRAAGSPFFATAEAPAPVEVLGSGAAGACPWDAPMAPVLPAAVVLSATQAQC